MKGLSGGSDGGVTSIRETGFFGPLDLRGLAVMDDDLDDPKTEGLDLLANDGEPGRSEVGGGIGRGMGMGAHDREGAEASSWNLDSYYTTLIES